MYVGGSHYLCGLFLSLMKEGLPTDMPVAVVDLDGSSNSRNLARQLDAFEQTKVMLTTVSFEEARQAMQEGKFMAFLYSEELWCGCDSWSAA